MTTKKASRFGFLVGILFSAGLLLFWYLARSISWSAPIPPTEVGLYFGYLIGLVAIIGVECSLLTAAMAGPDESAK